MSTMTAGGLTTEELIADLTNAHIREQSGKGESNEAAVTVDILLGTAFDKDDKRLKKLCYEVLGKKSGDAELTHRGNLGRLVALPYAPGTGLTEDPVRLLTGDEKQDKTRGEKYHRGLLRKYLALVNKTEDITPQVRLKWVVETFPTLQESLAHIHDYIKKAEEEKVTPIQNFFMGGGSIQKATKQVSTDSYEGDLDLAKTRAVEMRDLIDAFLEVVK